MEIKKPLSSFSAAVFFSRKTKIIRSPPPRRPFENFDNRRRPRFPQNHVADIFLCASAAILIFFDHHFALRGQLFLGLFEFLHLLSSLQKMGA
jgi:hypothetical protein